MTDNEIAEELCKDFSDMRICDALSIIKRLRALGIIKDGEKQEE